MMGLMLAYQGSEWTPDRAKEYLAFTAQVQTEGFKGTTEFEVIGPHLRSFVEELDTFHRTFEGFPELITGVGETVLFGLKIAREDLRGTVLLDCRIQDYSAADYVTSLQSYLRVEVSQIDYLRQFLHAVLTKGEQDSIQLLPKQ